MNQKGCSEILSEHSLSFIMPSQDMHSSYSALEVKIKGPAESAPAAPGPQTADLTFTVY